MCLRVRVLWLRRNLHGRTLGELKRIEHFKTLQSLGLGARGPSAQSEVQVVRVLPTSSKLTLESPVGGIDGLPISH